MPEIIVKDKDLYDFWEKWKKANTKYGEICPGYSLPFPDPILKKLATMIDSSLIVNHSTDKAYDFEDNIEMKSSSQKYGATPFKKSQSNCNRILFFRVINNTIEYYDIAHTSFLNEINTAAKNGKSITLMKYIKKYSIVPSTVIIQK